MAKWEGIKDVFRDFDPKILSKWTDDEVITVLESPKIIRNSRKVKAIISNAKVFLGIEAEFGTFEKYLKSFL